MMKKLIGSAILAAALALAAIPAAVAGDPVLSSDGHPAVSSDGQPVSSAVSGGGPGQTAVLSIWMLAVGVLATNPITMGGAWTLTTVGYPAFIGSAAAAAYAIGGHPGRT